MDQEPHAALGAAPITPPSATLAAPPRVDRLPAEVATRLLGVALTLGLLAQLLFVGKPLGLNLALWSVALIAGLALAARRVGRPGRRGLDPLDLWIPAGAVAFAVFTALRSDVTLLLFDVLVALALGALSSVALAGGRVTRRPVLGAAVAAFDASGAAVLGAPRLTAGVAPALDQLRRVARSEASRAVRGLLLALPFVLIFTALFAAADAVFARVVGEALRPRLALGDLPARVAVIVLAGWAAAGLLARAASRSHREPAERGGRTHSGPLGPVEVGIALVAIDAVFALFVGLQAAYLFGGLDTMELTGLTYSEYARRGFFELIAVAALAGLLVLGSHALVARRTRLVVFAGVALMLLTGVVLLSALTRLALYQQAYGWTELRFYALATLVWLGLAVVAAVVTLLRDRVRWLPHAVGLSALGVALAVNVVGPQAFVAERNVERLLHPELVPPDGSVGLDVSYAVWLGDDAIPALLTALPALPADDRELARGALARRLHRLDASRPETWGWQGWNLARVRALELLQAEPSLRSAPGNVPFP